MRRMAALLAMPDLAAVVDAPVPSRYSGFAAALGAPGLRNWLLAAPAALALDYVPALRRLLLTRFAAGGTLLIDLLADDAALDAHVRENAFGQWHACGTCRIGSADDRGAVVAPQSCRVHGIDGLRVVDASVMPIVPRANTNLTVMMIADHMASAIAQSDCRDP